MHKRITQITLIALAVAIGLAPGALAQGEWKFGLGTGMTSFSLDGDIGFPTSMGGVVFDVDLDNSDTSDLVESGFGLGGYASKGRWMIQFGAGTATLEDTDAGLTAEWERTQAEAAAVYHFAKAGKHVFGGLVGFRYIEHEWDFVTASQTTAVSEDWTDALVGLTHNVRFAQRWSWGNRIDAGFGDSEGSYLVSSTVNWHATRRWSFNLSVKQSSIEFGDVDEIANPDFYLYDIDEPGLGLGFMFHW